MQLRQWQAEALKIFRERGGCGYVEVATGAGKTRFAIAAADAIRETRSCPVIVLVPTRTLADQWALLLEKHYGAAPIRDPRTKLTGDLYLFTYRLASRRISELIQLFELPVFLICDEVHSLGAQNSRGIPTASASFRLGLSATPDRPYDDDSSAFLSAAIGPLIFQYSLDDAIGDGVLVPYDSINVKIPFSAFELHRYNTLTRRLAAAISTDDESVIKSLALQRSRIERAAIARPVVAALLAQQNKNSKIMIFFEDIVLAERCGRLCARQGLSYSLYHSRLSESARRTALHDFSYGLSRIIIACRALDEGFDEPSADCAIIAAASHTSRQRIQRIGRVLRTGSSKLHAKVFTLYASELERKLLMAFSSDASWMEVTI